MAAYFFRTAEGSSDQRERIQNIPRGNAHRPVRPRAPVDNRFTSGSAVEDSLFLSPNLLLLSDEFDSLLAKIKRGDPNADSILNTLLTLYTSAATDYERRFRANLKGTETISQPHLTIMRIATPKNYHGALNQQMIDGGYLARTIVLDASKRPPGQDSKPADGILTHGRVLETAKWWHSFQPSEGNFGNINPKPLTIEYADNARNVIRDFRAAADAEYQKAESDGDNGAMTVWGRAAENATRLALLAACSANVHDLRITVPQTKWAVEFMEAQVRRSLYLVEHYSALTEFDDKIERMKKVMRKLEGKRDGRPIPNWMIERHYGGATDDECKKVIESMMKRKLLQWTTVETGGRGRPFEGWQLTLS